MKMTLTAIKERRRLAITILWLIIILAGLVIIPRWRAAERSSIDVKIIGPEEVVFDWSKDACESNDFPDVPEMAFRDVSGRVQLIASHYISRRMIGPDLNHLTHDCAVLMRSDYDPDPARFADREWIHSVYTLDGMTVFALILMLSHRPISSPTSHIPMCRTPAPLVFSIPVTSFTIMPTVTTTPCFTWSSIGPNPGALA